MEEVLLSVKNALLESTEGLITGTIEAAPRVMTGIFLIILLWIVAKVVERILHKILTRVRFDALMQKIGLERTLSELGVRKPPSYVLSRIAYFLLLFLFAQAVVDGLGIAVISQAMGTFLGYLPNLVAAIVILVIGSAGGQVAARAVARAAENSGIEYGASLGGLVSGLILFVAGIMAIGQLRIETDIIRIVTICLLAGLALGFGLSFGLGTRDIAKNIMAGYYARKVFRLGESMEIRGERGVLKAITPTLTLLEKDGETVGVANTGYLEEIVRQQSD